MPFDIMYRSFYQSTCTYQFKVLSVFTYFFPKGKKEKIKTKRQKKTILVFFLSIITIYKVNNQFSSHEKWFKSE